MESLQKKPVENFPNLLNRFKNEIAKALPKHLNADRMARIALTSFRKNPDLGRCDPRSVFAAVLMASQLGWEVGVGGSAYLIPYKGECQLVPGWLGLVDLVHRSGRAAVWTGAVYEGDEFEYALGDNPRITHRPSPVPSDKLTYVYAVGRMTGASWPIIEVWPVGKVIQHRDRYNQQGQKHYSYKYFEMYARKVALLQVLKYMPKSAELGQAIELDHAAGSHTQDLSVKDAIDLTYAAEVEDTPEEIPGTPAAGVAGLKDQMASKSEEKRVKALHGDEIFGPPKGPGPKDAA